MTSRKGIALFGVLVALLLVTVLGAAMHHAAMGAQRRALARRNAVIAELAADAGLVGVVRDGMGPDPDGMAIGDTLPSINRPAGSGRVVVRGVRLSAAAWMLSAVAWFPDTVGAESAMRHASLIVRQDVPELDPGAALTLRDAGVVTGTGAVIGTDTTSRGLSAGCTPGSATAGVAMPDTTRLAGGGTVIGLPPRHEDPGLSALARYSAFGGESWASLTARAQVVLPAGSVVTPGPVVVGGVCDLSVAGNWGGAGACARHAPIVWARGSVELRGGSGQGTLLVDGDLTVSQGARFDGVVLVRDDVRTGIGGGWLRGAVLAADTAAGPGDHTLVGDALRIERASCLVRDVLARHARVVPVRGRAWAPM